MKRFFQTALALLLILALTVPALAADTEEDLVFYEQLSDAGKTLYDTMTTPENLRKFYTGEAIEIYFPGPFLSFRQATGAIFEANSYAVAAVEYCHPELFWINGSADSASGGESGVTLLVTPQFEPDWAGGGRDVSADSAAVTAAVQALAEEACVQGGPYEQLLYVHNWLTTHNEYNSTAAAAGGAAAFLPWTPLAALTDAARPVCEGYAKAFKLVCDELGYPCILVDGRTNGAHMWNQVLLNGQWYAVDVTYDDPVVNGVSGSISGHETQKYFLVGADTVVDGTPFSQSHVPDGQRIKGTRFAIPALASEAATPQGVSWLPPEAWDEPERHETPESAAFADVDGSAYYAPAVDWAVRCGVTKGTGSDALGNALFSPGAAVTRGQAVTFLWRALWEPEPEPAEFRFSDVAPGSYYEKAVLWAVENGITNGTTWDEANGVYAFSPDEPVTRSQLLTFLWRSLGRPVETAPYDGKPWYADAELWAGELGCLYGTAEVYSADALCPRADVVYYLWQAILSMAG